MRHYFAKRADAKNVEVSAAAPSVPVTVDDSMDSDS
jgi:hypothetical protein